MFASSSSPRPEHCLKEKPSFSFKRCLLANRETPDMYPPYGLQQTVPNDTFSIRFHYALGGSGMMGKGGGFQTSLFEGLVVRNAFEPHRLKVLSV